MKGPWVFVLVMAVVSAIWLVAGMLVANSAVQEAAVGATAAAGVVIPYCAARAIEALTK